MKPRLEKLKPTPLNISKFKSIYGEAFPVDEQRPWDDLLTKITESHEFFRAFAIMDGCHFVGFITAWDFPEALYIEHFATDPTLRGSGLGSQALTLFIAEAKKPVMLEVEPAETGDTARRRIGFYRRHGFVDRPDFEYIQPPYSAGTSPLPMTLMIYGELEPATARRLLYRHVYRAGDE